MKRANPTGTYLYCVVAAARRPRLTRVPAGLPGAGQVRLLDVEDGLFMAVADLPLDRYSESAINKGLGDLDWVSRIAIAHEKVVESFITSTAVLPMKLFTIFTTDDRALDHVRARRARIASLVRRVANHQEWGIRVVLDRTLAAALSKKKVATRSNSGISYLRQKKAQRDAATQLASRARDTVADLFDRLAARAGDAKRRAASELPVQGGPLLLDAAFLVARSRSGQFRALVGRQSKALASHGYQILLSGPWPPYTFISD